jgi:hypothetical protein
VLQEQLLVISQEHLLLLQQSNGQVNAQQAHPFITLNLLVKTTAAAAAAVARTRSSTLAQRCSLPAAQHLCSCLVREDLLPQLHRSCISSSLRQRHEQLLLQLQLPAMLGSVMTRAVLHSDMLELTNTQQQRQNINNNMFPEDTFGSLAADVG